MTYASFWTNVKLRNGLTPLIAMAAIVFYILKITTVVPLLVASLNRGHPNY